VICIRPYEKRFERDLVEICWRTGFMGESLEGAGRFEDKRLFALIFVLSFPRFEPESCFVAVEEKDGEPDSARAVGYIVGSANAAAQAEYFSRRFEPRIAARAFLYDSWRHPESLKQVLQFRRGSHKADGPKRPGSVTVPNPDYPACLHTNLLPAYQGKGLGTKLMRTYLDALRARGVPGVYLETSDQNRKALPFYKKMGFVLLREEPGEFWLGAPAQGLTFVQKLK
jgi:GNAT superfamily N-acetyltransferase